MIAQAAQLPLAQVFTNSHEYLAQFVLARAIFSTTPIIIARRILHNLFVACRQEQFPQSRMRLELLENRLIHYFIFHFLPILTKWHLSAASQLGSLLGRDSCSDLLPVFCIFKFLGLEVMFSCWPPLPIQFYAVPGEVGKASVIVICRIEVNCHNSIILSSGCLWQVHPIRARRHNAKLTRRPPVTTNYQPSRKAGKTTTLRAVGCSALLCR